MLKRTDAPYDAGRRGQAWIKVKKAFATLDVVVTAAEEGHGKRAGTLSDYTFAVWSSSGDSGAGNSGLEPEPGRELVNVGKAFSGLSDDDIVTMGRVFERSTLEKFGGVRLVRPEVVIEVAFDGIQRSKRHKSGFALRFPRILRFRPDKTAAEADTLTTVDALFRSQLESGHREDAPVVRAPRASDGAHAESEDEDAEVPRPAEQSDRGITTARPLRHARAQQEPLTAYWTYRDGLVILRSDEAE